jgi:hypothetical protein
VSGQLEEELSQGQSGPHLKMESKSFFPLPNEKIIMVTSIIN